jgi:hypothetical protein
VSKEEWKGRRSSNLTKWSERRRVREKSSLGAAGPWCFSNCFMKPFGLLLLLPIFIRYAISLKIPIEERF